MRTAPPSRAPAAWPRLPARWAPYVFLAPYVVLTAVFFVYPLIESVRLAFYQTAGPHAREWVGLANFRFIFGDPDFRLSLRNTAVFAVAGTLCLIPASLGLALLLHGARGRLRSALRLVFFLPSVLGQIFVGLAFAVAFTPRYGLFNRMTDALIGWGLEARWLEDPALVMPAIVLVHLWVYTGFNMIYFLAALQGVDEALVDAARIDGAGRWAMFRHITLPAIRPVLILVVLMSTIGALQLFELPYALMRTTNANNGPANSALFVVSYLYDAAFGVGDLGLAAAVGWVLALVIMTFSLIQLRLTQAIRR